MPVLLVPDPREVKQEGFLALRAEHAERNGHVPSLPPYAVEEILPAVERTPETVVLALELSSINRKSFSAERAEHFDHSPHDSSRNSSRSTFGTSGGGLNPPNLSCHSMAHAIEQKNLSSRSASGGMMNHFLQVAQMTRISASVFKEPSLPPKN